MKKKENYVKKFFQLIKKLRKTEKGRGILFFGFYFVFFLVLIILFRTMPSKPVSQINSNNNSQLYTYDKIFEGNYNFTYRINIDNNNFVYVGKKNNNIELFTFNDVNYYYDGVNYYTVDSNNIWTITDNPYMYTDFLNFSRLGEVLFDATYISKTEFGNGTAKFNYLISSNSICKVIDGIDLDIDEIPNSVVFTGSGDNFHLNTIELDFSSYGKFKGISSEVFKITLEYSNFGEIEEIVSPIE